MVDERYQYARTWKKIKEKFALFLGLKTLGSETLRSLAGASGVRTDGSVHRWADPSAIRNRGAVRFRGGVWVARSGVWAGAGLGVYNHCNPPVFIMTQASSPSAAGHSSLKQRHLSHLNSQLAQLHANLSDFTDLINTTCVQYKSIQRLGVMHGSLFMASHTVFENDQA